MITAGVNPSYVVWRTSSHSGNGPDCVEVAAVWRKSSRSGNGPSCVEVASVDRTIAVRDSKDPAGPRLAFTQREWETFVCTVKAGRLE